MPRTAPSLDGVDNAVVPQASRRIVRRALSGIKVADPGLAFLLRDVVSVALTDEGEDGGGLVATHN